MTGGWRAAAGFTIVEILVASAIMIAVTGAVFTIMNPAHGTFQAQPEVSDVQQRLRVAVDTIQGALLTAGAGTDSGSRPGGLLHYFAPVVPYRQGLVASDPAAGVFYRADALTLLHVPATSAQATLARPAAGTATELEIIASPNCPPAGAHTICGFADGTRVALFDDTGAAALATVVNVDGRLLQVHRFGGSAGAFDEMATITEIVSDTYYLKTDDRARSYQLMHYDGYKSDLPVVDDVVKLDFEYYGEAQPPAWIAGKLPSDPVAPWTTYGPKPPAPGADNVADTWAAGENCVFALASGLQIPRLTTLAAGAGQVRLEPALMTDGPWCPDATAAGRFDADLLRIRRVRVRLRVQAAAATLRGPASLLFTKGGSAVAANRFVPDQQVSFDVTPRNMNLGR
jgi:type II secretory pathway pseudopilin PulG